ncbi:MAG: type II toxin-antitoxin system VapB family antitoxin [Alphaproteobacteria bacterium]
MGQLNIKDAALIAEAKELAALLRTTATGAVRAAVQEKLAATKEARARKVAAIMEIVERASKLVPPGTTSDHSDLYDEMGLPR